MSYHWTRALPTAPGYYWWRHNPQAGAHIVDVSTPCGVAIAVGGQDCAKCSEWGGWWSSEPIPRPLPNTRRKKRIRMAIARLEQRIGACE